jgi:hypothetical protein
MVGRAIVGENAATVDPLFREPAHGTGEKANGRGPSLIGQHFDVGTSCGIVTDATGGALPSIAAEAMSNPLGSGQLLDVDMDHAASSIPLFAHNWLFRHTHWSIEQPGWTTHLTGDSGITAKKLAICRRPLLGFAFWRWGSRGSNSAKANYEFAAFTRLLDPLAIGRTPGERRQKHASA